MQGDQGGLLTTSLSPIPTPPMQGDRGDLILQFLQLTVRHEDFRHGNPPSSLHVVADIQGNITLSYPNGSVKHISIEQQMKIHEETIAKRNS